MMGASPLIDASQSGVAPSRFESSGVGLCAKQKVDHLLVGLEHGPMKRCRAISLRCIHIGALLHQFACRRLVTAHERVCNFGPSGTKADDATTAATRNQPRQWQRCVS
jgi:hypothetical protein